MHSANGTVNSREFLKKVIQRLVRRENLTADEATRLMEIFIAGDFEHVQLGCIIMGLRLKRETPEELKGLLLPYRRAAQPIDVPERFNFVDLCGTGGDGPSADVFNISTTAAFVACGAGVPIVKHGTSAVSSQSGSSDVLAALGIQPTLTSEDVKYRLENGGIAYLHGPALNSAMRNVIAPRHASGMRSFFNLLGPMSNPARPKRQIIGIYSQDYTEIVAQTLAMVGSERVMVVSADDGLDELSIHVPTKISELKDGKVHTYSFKPSEYGFSTMNYSEVTGGNPEFNARKMVDILQGKVRGCALDVVVLNAAAVIMIGGLAETMGQALELARNSIEQGKAFAALEHSRKARRAATT